MNGGAADVNKRDLFHMGGKYFQMTDPTLQAGKLSPEVQRFSGSDSHRSAAGIGGREERAQQVQRPGGHGWVLFVRGTKASSQLCKLSTLISALGRQRQEGPGVQSQYRLCKTGLEPGSGGARL